MSISRSWSVLALLAITAPLLAPPRLQAAALRADCLKGCLGEGDESVNLLKRASQADPVTLRWMTSEEPTPEGSSIVLYAGNPKRESQLPELGRLEFKHEGARWFATWEFKGDEMGKGTFLTVLVRRDGSRETILDWRAFRLLTTDEQAKEARGPAGNTNWELQVMPGAIRADSSRGSLPRNQGGDQSVWWSLAESQDSLTNLDLDGENTGVPGLGLQVSAPWAARDAADNPMQGLANKLGAPDGHTVHFEDLTWTEQDPKLVDLSRQAESLKISLRSYYTVVTLYTNASFKTFDKSEVLDYFGLFSRTFFSHETSARFKQPGDPRFWASYDEREYGSDKHLLELLRKRVSADKSVPGLPEVQVEDGDGGSVTFQAAFHVKARPWSLAGKATEQAPVGIVGLDVVASRSGYGSAITHGSAGGSAIDQALAKLTGPSAAGKALDLDNPPEGFFTAAVTAQTGTKSGTLPLLREPPALAQRGVEGQASSPEAVYETTTPKGTTGSVLDELIKAASGKGTPRDELFKRLELPQEVRFPITATLRAGALVEGKPRGAITNMVPINAYAQYVVKLTVAMLPETALTTSGEALAASQKEMAVQTTADKKPGLELPSVLKPGWKSMVLLGVVGLVALIVLLYQVPGLRVFLTGWLKYFTPKSKD